MGLVFIILPKISYSFSLYEGFPSIMCNMVLNGTGKHTKFTKFYKFMDPSLLIEAEWSNITGF